MCESREATRLRESGDERESPRQRDRESGGAHAAVSETTSERELGREIERERGNERETIQRDGGREDTREREGTGK